MNTFTKNLYAMIAVGIVSGSVSAKELYIAANGSDSNTGVTADSPRATLTSLNDIIEPGDVINVSGMIDMTKEIALGDGVQDKNLTWGHYISYNEGKHNGFYINGSNTAVDGKISPWKNITITGNDASEDGFDGGDAMRMFYVRGDNQNNTVTFKNLTFRNGLAPKEGAGAIFIHDNGWVEIDNCVFEHNHLDYAVLTEEEHSSGAVKLKNSNSERGGAVYIQFGKLTMNDCQFTDNHNRRGGALMVTGGDVKVTRCRFENNGAEIEDGKYLDDSRGGAVHLWPLNTALTASFDHCDFVGNVTWNGSGALYLQSNTDSSNLLDALFTNCSFIQNRTADGQGGAAVIANAENFSSKDDRLKNIFATFANTTFMLNESKSEGGAVFMSGGIQKDELRFVNCTIVKNTTAGNAGHGAGYAEGIANDTFKPEDAGRYFYNCIVEQNVAPGAGNGRGEYSDMLNFGYLVAANSHFGRIVFTKITEQDFYDTLTSQGYDKENVWHAGNDYHLDEEGNTLLLSEDALNAFEWSGGTFTFATLDEGSELLKAGNPEYLTMESKVVTAPNGKEFTVQGYDISKSDQMGFERAEGTCAVGSMEVSTKDVEPYWDGRDFPYMDDGSSVVIETIMQSAGTVVCKGNVVTAAGAELTVYNVSGVAVARAFESVDLSSLPAGLYIVEAATAKNVSTVKVVR